MTDYIQEFKEAVPKAIAKAWSDPAFDSLLVSNPNKAFESLGVVLPANLELRIVKHDSANANGWTLSESNGKQIMTLPLPPAPSGGVDRPRIAADACSSSTCCTG
jgi:ribosomally synthesized peptide (two-chain TOMM family)